MIIRTTTGGTSRLYTLVYPPDADAAADPRTSPSDQLLLARDARTQVRARLARNPNLAIGAQYALAGDPDLGVLLLLAANRAVTEPTQAMIADRADGTVALALALVTNESLAPALQERYTRHPLAYLRARLAENPALTGRAASALAAGSSVTVHTSLLENPTAHAHDALPVELLHTTPRGRVVLDARLERFDPALTAVLAPGWAGTLKELELALEDFSTA